MRANRDLLFAALVVVIMVLAAGAYAGHRSPTAPIARSFGSPPAQDVSVARGGATQSGPPPSVVPAQTQWQVGDTLVVYNDTLVPGNFYGANNYEPCGMAYDNLSSEVFIAGCYGSGSLSVLSDTTNNVLDANSALVGPAVAFDYKDNEVFQLQSGSPESVAVVSAATDNVLTTIPVGDTYGAGVQGIVYAAPLNEVFVADASSANISVISTVTDTVVANVTMPSTWAPTELVYDAAQNDLFMLGEPNNNFLGIGYVSVISAASNVIVQNISVHQQPASLAYDSGKGEIFVECDYNMTVISDATNTVVAWFDAGTAAADLAYDPALGEIYYTNPGTGNLTVVSDVSNTLVANVTVGEYVYGALYDSGKGEVWTIGPYPGVLSSFPGKAYAISTTTRTITASVQLSFLGRFSVYDSGQNEVFESNFLSDQVAAVSGATDHVVGLVTVGTEPLGMAYDRARGEVFVINHASENVSVINDTTDTVVATVPVGLAPECAAYDPAKGEVFVSNQGGNVSVINDTTNLDVASVNNVGDGLLGVAYDPVQGEIFVDTDLNVSVINDTTNSIVTWVGAEGGWGIAYDSAKGEMFVSTLGSDVNVISDATRSVVATISTGTQSSGVAYDPAAGEVFVGSFGATGNLSVISDTTNQGVDSVIDGQAPTGLAFDTANGDLYSLDKTFGMVDVISPTSGGPPPHYPVTFVEAGLPIGTPWSITFNATLSPSTTNMIAYSVLNGDYSYTVGAVTGYTANVTGGPITVNGAGVTLDIGFSPSGVPTYPVTFDETGLQASTSWTVTLGGSPLSSTTGSLQFSEANGNYSYAVGAVAGYTAAPSSGSVTVSGGPRTVDIAFSAQTSTPTLYPVTFTEAGLASGTSWSVSLMGTLLTSTNPTVGTTDPNGSYSFSVPSVTGYSVSPASGTVMVQGAAVQVAIAFSSTAGSSPPPGSPSTGGFLGLSSTEGWLLLGLVLIVIAVALLLLAFARRPTYPVIFLESGLSPGTRWSVRLQKVAEFSESETIRFSRPRGTYEYEVAPTSGQTATPATGYVVVEKESQQISVRFDGTAKPP